MKSVWIIGRKAIILANNHEYMAPPFLGYATEAEALRAREVVEKISGEKVMIAEVPMMSEQP